MRIAVLAVVWLAAAACSTAPLPALPAPAGDEAVVLVPGYKGSFLVEEDGAHAWITPAQVLVAGDRSLALPFAGQRTAARFGRLRPEGPITRVSLLGFSQEVYLPFLEFAKARLPGVVAFAYDWRQDVRDSGRELCAVIDKLPAARVAIVAHSMGGYVALHCLRRGSRKISRVVFAGTPFSGAPEIFKDLVRGNPIGRNTALLSVDALFTFTSAWQLLPHSGEIFTDAAGTALARDALDPRLWRSGLGVFAKASLRGDPAYAEELAHQLAAANAHWQALQGFAPEVPVLAVIGRGRSTVAGVRVGPRGFDFEHPPTTDGDGTVTLESARPPFAHQTFSTSAGHVALLNDAEVQQAIARFLGRREPGYESRPGEAVQRERP